MGGPERACDLLCSPKGAGNFEALKARVWREVPEAMQGPGKGGLGSSSKRTVWRMVRLDLRAGFKRSPCSTAQLTQFRV